MAPYIKSDCRLQKLTHIAAGCLSIHDCFFRGNTKETKGTGYVVYEDIFDAKSACEHLSGFGLQGRYLIVTYYQAGKMAKRLQNERIQREIDEAMLAKRQPTTNNATDPNTTA